MMHDISTEVVWPAGLQARLRALARTLPILPAIYQHGNKRSHEIAADLGVNVADWPAVYKLRAASGAHRRLISEPVVEKVGHPPLPPLPHTQTLRCTHFEESNSLCNQQ